MSSTSDIQQMLIKTYKLVCEFKSCVIVCVYIYLSLYRVALVHCYGLVFSIQVHFVHGPCLILKDVTVRFRCKMEQ